MPKDPYSGRTAPLTYKCCILYNYSTNTGTEYFKHGIYCPFFPLQNAVCFIILTYLVGKLEGRRPLGRPRRKWVDIIRTDLQEVGCEYMAWIGLAQDRDRWRTLVSAVMNLGVP